MVEIRNMHLILEDTDQEQAVSMAKTIMQRVARGLDRGMPEAAVENLKLSLEFKGTLAEDELVAAAARGILTRLEEG